jgi:hypothetical protein
MISHLEIMLAAGPGRWLSRSDLVLWAPRSPLRRVPDGLLSRVLRTRPGGGLAAAFDPPADLGCASQPVIGLAYLLTDLRELGILQSFRGCRGTACGLIE